MTGSEHRGVFLADVPLGVADGAPEGPVLLLVEIAEELVRPYEWVQEGLPYREFCVPAEYATTCF